MVVVNVGAVCLYAQANVVPINRIVGDSDSTHVVHADANEAQEGVRWNRRVRNDGVALDNAVLGADGQGSVIGAVGESVFTDGSVLRADDGDVETIEAGNGKAGHGDVFDTTPNGADFSVFGDEGREVNAGAGDADTRLGV